MVRFDNLLKIDFDDVLHAAGLRRKSEAPGVGGFFIGLGLGLLGGAAASMLLTPYKGSETREKLLKAGEELGRTVSTKVNELANQVNGQQTATNGLPNGTYNQGARIGSI